MGLQTSKRKEALTEDSFVLAGIYSKAPTIDRRWLRKNIQQGKLCPLTNGISEVPEGEDRWDYEECPICFLIYYCGLNTLQCCKKRMCTECFLQLAHGDRKGGGCPFCNNAEFRVTFSGKLSADQRQELQADECRTKAVEQRILDEDRARDAERLRLRSLEREQKTKQSDKMAVCGVQRRPPPGDCGTTGEDDLIRMACELSLVER